MTKDDLRKDFEKETGFNWINSQKEPDIDYVDWLENKIIDTDNNIDILLNKLN